MKILILKLSLIVAITSMTFVCLGQNSYGFKPWKSKSEFENRKILFLIDTTCTREETEILLITASKIDDNLKNKGFETEPIPFPNDTVIDSNTLCLKLENLKMAYVKLNTFEKRLPLCFRVKVTQMHPINKKLIETIISVSADKQQEGFDQMGGAFAERLLRHFKTE